MRLRTDSPWGGSPIPADVGTSFKTFSSPASKSVRVHKAVTSATATTGPSPDLGISLNAEQMNAFGISLEVTPTDYDYVAGDSLTLTVTWGDGTQSTVVDSTADADWDDHTYSRLGAYTITVTANDNQGDTATNTVTGAQTAGSEFVPYTPTRILDTRNAIGAPAAPIPAGGNLTLKVDGAPGLPGSGVDAIAANLTVTGSSTNGFISAYPENGTVPNVSSVNYAPHQIVPDMAIVPVNTSNGEITIHNSSKGWVQVLVDVFGYYTADTGIARESAYLPATTPFRWLDTRDVFGKHEPLQGDRPSAMPFTTDPGVTGMVFNTTIVGPSSNGFLALYPFDTDNPGAVPGTSNVNYGPGQIVANLVIASPGTTTAVVDDQNYYEIGLYLASHGQSDVILDSFGEFVDD